MGENEEIASHKEEKRKPSAGELKKQTAGRRFPYRVSKKDFEESHRIRTMLKKGAYKGAQTKLDAYNKRAKEKRMEVMNEEFTLRGKRFTKPMLMDYICSNVSEGMALDEVCEEPGMPTMQAVYGWFDNFPSFQREYERAEEIRGHRLGEEALRIGKKTDRENVTADKLRVEVLSKAAARSNRRFQEKTVVETRDEYQSMTEEQIRARVEALLRANPELAGMLREQNLVGPGILELLPEPSPPTLDCESVQTPESDDTAPTDKGPLD